MPIGNDDCDIFEIAEELYLVLEHCRAALNWIPNTKLRGCAYSSSYELAAAVNHALNTYRERI